MILDKMKVHRDGLSLHASDALYFTALEHAAVNDTCHRIFNSPPQREGLDRFKMHYLFKPIPVPFYVSNLAIYRSAMRMARLREYLVVRLKNMRRGRRPVADGTTNTLAPGTLQSATSPKTHESVAHTMR